MSIRLLCALVLAASPAACTDGKDADTTDTDADTDADTDTDSDTDTDTDTDTEVSEFGLDERPTNETCVAVPRPVGDADVQLTRVYAGVSFFGATQLVMAPGLPDRWYVAEQAGRIWRFDDDPGVNTRDEVLDLTGPVIDGGEMGLLGIAFHPDFAANGQLYVHYSAAGGGANHRTRVSRFTSTDGGDSFDASTEEILFETDQPYSNHNGGSLLFGPDGYLYLGLGDGGSGDDPEERAQNPFEVLGKILRFDVDGGDPYAIPADNPYAAGGGAPEIYALGLRNPFRFTFDPQSGDLWVGDVGQDAWEEIDLVELGGNYGWDVREGFECHEPVVNCPSAGFVDPVAVISHQSGGAKSIIAGAVYHGAAIPSLRGTLLYNDFYDGDIFGLFFDPVTGDPQPREILSNTGRLFGHYAADEDGEVYLLDYNGQIHKLEPAGPPPADPFPELLSATGCFDPADPTVPAEGLVPYDVSHAFWSDGGDKKRWLALPEGAAITVGPDGDWDLPIGSVLAKEFTVEGRRIETRLMMRHDDGTWGGYSYAWNDAETDATLLYSGLQIPLTSQIWSIPGECATCHNVAAGGSLGLETAQLNGLETYPATGRTANQIATLANVGMLDGDPAALQATEPFPARDDAAADLDTRARTYLHVNCGVCHRPDGPTPSDLDFRVTTALADTNACDVEPVQGDLGVDGARIIAPGDPGRSVVSLRMHVRDANQMPPTGSTVVDDDGAALIDEWITSLAGCN